MKHISNFRNITFISPFFKITHHGQFFTHTCVHTHMPTRSHILAHINNSFHTSVCIDEWKYAAIYEVCINRAISGTCTRARHLTATLSIHAHLQNVTFFPKKLTENCPTNRLFVISEERSAFIK